MILRIGLVGMDCAWPILCYYTILLTTALSVLKLNVNIGARRVVVLCVCANLPAEIMLS